MIVDAILLDNRSCNFQKFALIITNEKLSFKGNKSLMHIAELAPQPNLSDNLNKPGIRTVFFIDRI